MSATVTYRRPKGIIYTVNAAEASSGIVYVPVTSTPVAGHSLVKNVTVFTTAGVEKTSAATIYYDSTSGNLVVANQGGFTLVTDDEINAQLMYI